MDSDRFRKQINFLIEVDKLKHIKRRNLLMDGSRNENDAEHSWHLVMMALLLSEHAKDIAFDLLKVIKMLIIHDLVEIYAGDVFAYDKEGLKTKLENEKKAATQIFGLLPEDQYMEFKKLWEEFEEGKTVEAKVAIVYDKFQPELHNFNTKGIVWLNHKVTPDKILERNKETGATFPIIWEHIQNIVNESIVKNYIHEEY